MARIPLFGVGRTGRSSYVTAKSLTNIYVEARPRGEKSALVAYGTPGRDLFVNVGATPCRGGIEFEANSVAYFVHRGVLWEVNNAGITTNRGTLATTTGRVSMAHNGVEVMMVDGTSGYIYDTTTTVFSTIASALFANPTTVTYLGRRFVCSFLGSSRFQWSDVDDGLTFQALNFANAEVSPDPIVAVLSSNGQLILNGALTTEFWGQSGIADSPFTPLQGTAAEWGLAARWSIAKFDNTYACLIKNRMGEVMVAKMAGYVPQKISTVDVDEEINAYADVADATAYSYMRGGHALYVISFPAAGVTWMYDAFSNEWSKLKSFGITRDIGEFSFTLLANTIVADYASGILYKLNPASYTDNGTMIERIVVSENIVSPDLDELDISCLRLDMEVGVGTTSGQGVNPLIGLRVSRDNGRTWGAQTWKTLGALGEYKTIVEWRRLGTARAFNFEFSITDPVKVVFVSASVNPEN